eukprot:8916315-Alexandrium_andersonii.AAC.1
MAAGGSSARDRGEAPSSPSAARSQPQGLSRSSLCRIGAWYFGSTETIVTALFASPPPSMMADDQQVRVHGA